MTDSGNAARARLAARYVASALRRRIPSLRRHRVRIRRDVWMWADLDTPRGLHLYRYGVDDAVSRALSSILSEGSGFIDGGANVGMYSFVAATVVGPTGHVVACEPSPGTMRFLQENIDLNPGLPVDALEIAIADAPGKFSFVSFEPGSGVSSFAPPNPGEGTEHVVDVMTLDQIAAKLRAPLALVKLDLEGSEIRALAGAGKLLETSRPTFIIEVEPKHLAYQGGNVADLSSILSGARYVAYALRAGAGRGLAVRLAPDWTPSGPEPNLLVVPEERGESILSQFA